MMQSVMVVILSVVREVLLLLRRGDGFAMVGAVFHGLVLGPIGMDIGDRIGTRGAVPTDVLIINIK